MNVLEYLKDHPVVLASGSPRRKELLAQIGIFPQIVPSGASEDTRETQPDRMVMELARRKALDVAGGCRAGTLVIGADASTVKTHLLSAGALALALFCL